jgi:hypothetical protein
MSLFALRSFLLFAMDRFEELNGPMDTALQRVIAEVKQRWSIIGWVAKNLLS